MSYKKRMVPLPSEKLCPLTRLVCVQSVPLCCEVTQGAHTLGPPPPL